jgi:A/G-specific adenine glycosylase
MRERLWKVESVEIDGYRYAPPILRELWCPPQFDDEIAARDWFERSGMEARDGEKLETFTHTFTHFRLHITPLKIQLVRKPLRVEQTGSVWLDVGEALGAAIPTPVRKVLEQL